MRALLFLLPVALAACSNSGGGGNPFVTPADLAGAQIDAGGAAGWYLPTGYSLVPFAGAEAKHDFPMADPVLAKGLDYQAVLETDAGRLVLDLLETQTPNTVNSFVFLTLHHYFDGIAFHRVLDKFVAQAGDPNTLETNRANWGQGGPGYGFGLEIVDTLKYSEAGVVGMARTNDPNSNGSQFFITLDATPNLNGQYTIFARVTEGLDVLPKIARGMPPQTPTRITRVYIVAK